MMQLSVYHLQYSVLWTWCVDVTVMLCVGLIPPCIDIRISDAHERQSRPPIPFPLPDGLPQGALTICYLLRFKFLVARKAAKSRVETCLGRSAAHYLVSWWRQSKRNLLNDLESTLQDVSAISDLLQGVITVILPET